MIKSWECVCKLNYDEQRTDKCTVRANTRDKARLFACQILGRKHNTKIVDAISIKELA